MIAVLLGVSVLFLFLLAGRSKIDLGPSIKGAQDVQICVLLPDARPNFDVTRAEKTVEDSLKSLGALRATARVQRPPDVCPPPSPRATPTPTPTPSPSASR